MLSLQELQVQQARLVEAIAKLEQQLTAIGGEEYRGCWLDSAQNRKGTQYTRLRWFKSLETKQKGCRTLKPDEVARAEQAIALWLELEEKRSRLMWVEQAMQRIQTRIAQLSG